MFIQRIYKVHIISNETTTIFKVNNFILATVSNTGCGYKLIVGENKTEQSEYQTMEEAIDKAKERITAFFASLGIAPNFIME